jgi:uncharacterized protein
VENFFVLNPTASYPELCRVCALAVMTKAPQPGRVKTRLVPPLTWDSAAELNKCFLRDTADAILSACSRLMDDVTRKGLPPGDSTEQLEAVPTSARGVAVYTPVGDESVYEDILPPDFLLLPQRGEQFGERLYLAAEDLFNCGFEAVCLIDSDSPTVPAENFAEALRLLRATGDRMVLGPSDDGGYYLIGIKSLHRELFERIEWSTESVLGQTIERAHELSLEVKLLPTGYDVDDGVTLRRLQQELLSKKTFSDLAPHTREFLRALSSQGKL